MNALARQPRQLIHIGGSDLGADPVGVVQRKLGHAPQLHLETRPPPLWRAHQVMPHDPQSDPVGAQQGVQVDALCDPAACPLH